MKIPGFSAEASIQVRGRQSWSGGPVAGSAAGVVPARFPCSVCFNGPCLKNFRDPLCQLCLRSCIP
jgi:hypothetical protein